MPTQVHFYDADGNEVVLEAYQLVREVVVSTERKIHHEGKTAGAFVSEKSVIPAGLTLVSEEDLDTQATALAETVERKCDERYAVRCSIVFGSSKGTYTPPANKPTTPPQSSRDGQRLAGPPPAAERQPGDWWTIDCQEYELTAKQFALWSPIDESGNANTERECAEVTIPHFMDKKQTKLHPCWPPEAWIKHMQMDGSRQSFKYPVRITQKVGNRTFTKEDKKYYYVNTTHIEIVKE